jgi:hypothetical protein
VASRWVKDGEAPLIREAFDVEEVTTADTRRNIGIIINDATYQKRIANMKKLVLLAAALFAGHAMFIGLAGSTPGPAPDAAISRLAGHGGSGADGAIANAFTRRQSNVQVAGEGKVIRLLPDDDNGSRHQKFIIRLGNGQTLLISHNIDLAPRVSALRAGDSIGFSGEYEWSEKGGVVHWTHRDPRGSHAAGWLKHNGRIYQ